MSSHGRSSMSSLPRYTEARRSSGIFRGLAALAVIAGVTAGCGPPMAASRTGEQELLQARLERGQYLAEGPMHCFRCHSEIDWEAPGGLPVPGKKGGGSVQSVTQVSPPFELVKPNISPDRETGVGEWTDEELARAIREGIGRDGRRLFLQMPYVSFRDLSDEDLASVIAYIRSIEPVKNKLVSADLPRALKEILPPRQPITQPVPGPDMSDPVQRGAYLAKLGGCYRCHTAIDQRGQASPDLAFGGGAVYRGAWGEAASANLTPHASGIPYYDEDLFLSVMRTGAVRAHKIVDVMPWAYFRNMTDEDLKAILAYLRTLNPVRHRVDNTEPSAPCKKCGRTHGLGAHNGLFAKLEEQI